ncbi:MAG: DJ-1/PfpI family protein [Alphaproteobacteria bacterium]
MTRRTLGALVFPGFELLDLFGPLEMFGMYPDAFSVRIVAQSPGPVASTRNGPSVAVDDLLADGPRYDVLLVPGGPGTRNEVANHALISWLGQAAAEAELIFSVCTGSVLLARTGMLDGRRATSNKRALHWARS